MNDVSLMLFSEGKSTYKNTANQVLLLLLLCHTQSNPFSPQLWLFLKCSTLDYIFVKRPEGKDLQLEIRAQYFYCTIFANVCCFYLSKLPLVVSSVIWWRMPPLGDGYLPHFPVAYHHRPPATNLKNGFVIKYQYEARLPPNWLETMMTSSCCQSLSKEQFGAIS